MGSAGTDAQVRRFHTTGRGGVNVVGDRLKPIPGSGAVGSVCVHELELFGFTTNDRRRTRQCVRRAVTNMLDPGESLCQQDSLALPEAVEDL